MEQISNDQLDLKELFFDAAVVMKKNAVLITVIVFICISLALIYSVFGKKVYESKMIITSSLLTLTYTEELLENVNRLRDEKKYEYVAAKFNVKPDIISKINSISVTSALEENEIQTLKESEKTHLLVTVKTFDPLIFPELEKGIVNYLENNDYVRIRTEQSRVFYKELIAKVESELADLETFKQTLINGRLIESKQGNLMFDPTSVNTKIIELTKEKINYQQALKLSNNIQVISGLNTFEQQAWPRKSVMALIGIIFGFILSILIISIKEINEGVKKRQLAN